jgi:hypothetical protein
MCEDFDWPTVFACGWTEVVRLYNLGSAIAAITAGDALYVNRLDVQSWARFLQILEDAGPVWMMAVLYGPAVQNITTCEALKNILTANDPGGIVPVRGAISLQHDILEVQGHTRQARRNSDECAGGSQGPLSR